MLLRILIVNKKLHINEAAICLLLFLFYAPFVIGQKSNSNLPARSNVLKQSLLSERQGSNSLSKNMFFKGRLIAEADSGSLKEHNPKKATLLSALLPGAGQIYNKKYYKAPIVWAGFAGLIYLVDRNAGLYQKYYNAYNIRTDGDEQTVDEFVDVFSESDLKYYKDDFRRDRDLSIIATVGWYLICIIDANVDAHLFDFDVSDDLSMHIVPVNYNAGSRPAYTTGISFKFKL